MPLFGPPNVLPVAAATPAGGVALVNGTPAILTWTVPNDGLEHPAALLASLAVTATETGGAITIGYTAPDGTATTHTVFAAGQAGPDVIVMGAPFDLVVKAGTAVTIAQSSALTGGTARLFAKILGS
jgi:hypothetical protein